MKTVKDGNIYKAIQSGTITHYWKNSYAINATKYGTLTENNGVASGFSTSNYYNAGLINIDSHNFEIGFKVYGYSTSHDNPVYANQTSRKYLPRIFVKTSGEISVLIANGTSSWDVCNLTTTETIPNNTWVWCKVIFDGTAYTVNTSLNGQTWDEIGRYATTAKYSQNLNTVGACYDTGSTGLKQGYGGQIDFTGCYFNIDGVRVWDGSYISSRTEVTSADNYDYTTTENVYKGVNL